MAVMGDDFIEMMVDIAASPATVYSLFLDSEGFSEWMGVGSSIDPKPGGRVRVQFPNGDAAEGEVVEMISGERITLTWGYTNPKTGLAPGASTVTFRFERTPLGTRVHLRHEGLKTTELREGHVMGWRHNCGMMASRAAARQHDGVLKRAVSAFVDAWNERDEAKRRALLESCLAEDAIYRDAMCSVAGIDDLNAYIEQFHRFVPGSRLNVTGDLQQSHGHFAIPVTMGMGPNRDAQRGLNVGATGVDGKIAWVVGFPESPVQ
jgi:uncharacterized protein YndB with AHSA1/START domain